MKILPACLLILGIITFAGGTPVKADDNDEAGCVCEKSLLPVCGSDGKTYPNICQAHCVGITTVTPGKCQKTDAANSTQATNTVQPLVTTGGCVCPKKPRTVCGSDVNTYTNECMAKCAGFSVLSQGECTAEQKSKAPKRKTPCPCPRTLKWVCGENSKSFANACEAKCDGVKVASEGKCANEAPTAPPSKGPKQCYCNKEYEPVCGEDGNTYANECMASTCAGIKIVSKAECPEDTKRCVCPRIYDPVCGDGKDYSNPCEADCAGAKNQASGKCSGDSDDDGAFVLFGNSEPKVCDCPETIEKVCGSDGTTYNNECEAVCQDQTVQSKGECHDGPSPASKGREMKKKTNNTKTQPKPPTKAPNKTQTNNTETNNTQAPTQAPCLCPKTLRYVCGVDGKTYSNDCEAECRKAEIKSVGMCPGFNPYGPDSSEDSSNSGVSSRSSKHKGKVCVCEQLHEPVCGADSKTYPNKCEADCRGVAVLFSDECPEDVSDEASASSPPKKVCICPRILSPVCGTDNKTYNNECGAKCAGVGVQFEYECPEAEPSKAVTTKQKPKECLCSKTQSPVCGTDNKTYKNKCEAKCAGVEVQFDEECPTDESAEETAAPPSNKVCVCPHTLFPVCGTDNKTYKNKCEAKCAGVGVQFDEECPVDESDEGTATPPSQKVCVCPKTLEPVCGTDNITYKNKCGAKCAGVGVKFEKECPKDDSEMATKVAQSNKPKGCNCTKTEKPICGTDNKTYKNKCLAKCAGVGVQFDEECPKDESDETTNVTPNPKVCTCSKTLSPVCGTDNKTYKNKCLAKCAGVGVQFDEECPKDESDETTNVTPNPKVCTCSKTLSPVCGTDNKTYNNKCFAKCAGVGVKFEKECPKGVLNKTTTVRPKTKKCICPRTFEPVCGTDNKTYTNKCGADCAGVGVKSTGTCPDNTDSEKLPTRAPKKKLCICPKNLRPVCGSNGVNYANKCLAACAGATVKHSGDCLPETDEADINGTDCSHCPGSLNLVCGTDQQTYNNACKAICAGVEVIHKGGCD